MDDVLSMIVAMPWGCTTLFAVQLSFVAALFPLLAAAGWVLFVTKRHVRGTFTHILAAFPRVLAIRVSNRLPMWLKSY